MNLTAEQRAEKVRRIQSMLMKADPARNDNANERQAFRDHADRLMDQYGISESECRPQETRRPSYSNPQWTNPHFWDDLLRQAKEQAARDEARARAQQAEWERDRKQREEAQERAIKHFLKTMMETLQQRGKAFVHLEFLVTADRRIDSLLENELAGWNCRADYDSPRDGYWIKLPTYEDPPSTWSQSSHTGGASADYVMFDEFGSFMDGQRRNFDHSRCPHPQTPAARAKCRRDRKAAGL